MAEETQSLLAAPTETPEQLEAKRVNQELASKWLKAIARRRSKEKTWRDKARKVIDRYRDDRDAIDEQVTKFNILWANTEVLKPAIFARMPIADVRRRYLTRDPIARTGAMIMERALSYCMDSYDFKDTLDRAEEDYLLPGRGQVIVCYKPYFKKTEVRKNEVPLPPSDEDPSNIRGANGWLYKKGTQFDDQGAYSMQPQEEKLYEEVYSEYQPWDLYVFSDAKQRCKVQWEAYGDRLTKEELQDEYPEFKGIDDLTFAEPKLDEYEQRYSDVEPLKKIIVWKVWDKTHRKLMVFAEGYKEGPLVPPQEDPLGLENFFPSPEPLYAIRTNNDTCPKPEFLMYQDQANELDILVARQRALTSALKYRGLYDKRFDTDELKLSTLTKSPDNTFLPAPGFAELVEKGGFESVIAALPIEEIAKVLGWLAGRIEILKQEIYEVYGISDIVRGTTKASETLGAQQLKAQYAGMRISTRQERFQRFIRDILRIKAEIIAEHFSPQTLQVMTGIDVIPDAQHAQLKQSGELQPNTVSETEFQQACALIKSDKLRGFRIDIETDSTVPVDKDTEQKNRVEFMSAVGGYLQGIIPAVQMGAIPIKLAREGLLFVVRGFKVGTELEEVLEEMGDSSEAEQLGQMKQMQAQMQEQLQAVQEENAKLKETNAQLQSKAQAEMMKAEQKAQLDQVTAQNDQRLKEQEAAHNAALAEREAAQTAQLERERASHEAELEAAKAEREALIDGNKAAQEMAIREKEAELDARIKLLEANIQAQQAEQQAKQAEKAEGEKKSGDDVSSGIKALLEQSTKPRTRKGKAKLPSGGIMEFEMQDS